jgi:hypothetical protein
MFRNFLKGLLRVVFDSYRHGRWIWHVLACVITYTLVMASVDWRYFIATRDISHWGIIAAVAGFCVPIIVPFTLYILGTFRRREHLRLAGLAVAQAAIVGWLISSFYKVFTGRSGSGRS